MKLKLVVPLLVATAGLAFFAGDGLATLGGGITTTILGQSRFDPINVTGKAPAVPWHAVMRTHGESDVYVVDNKLAPGGTTGWHTHPGPSMILVVSGSVTNYIGSDPGCTPHVYSAGQGFVDPGHGEVHTLRNETDADAETIAVQVLPAGGVRRIDSPDPGNCHF